MAAGTYQAIVPWSPEIYTRGTTELYLKASQTFKKGAPLVSNGGYFEEAGSGPATIAYISADPAQNGASDGLYTVPAWRVVAGDQWQISCEDAHAITDYLANWGLVKDATTGFWYADSANSSDQVVFLKPVQTPQLGAIGDTKFSAIFEFQTANIAAA